MNETSTAEADPPRARGASARVAMVGAGQLARMTQQAAIQLGVELTVLAETDEDPAVLAGARRVLGSPASLEDLRALAAAGDVVSFDHEQVPPEHLAALEESGVELQPRPAAKLLAQDKDVARRTLAAAGLPVPPFELVTEAGQAEGFAARHGWPLIGKAPRGGYDGRGVFELEDSRAVAAELERFPDGLIVEPRLELVRELAMIVARRPGGETAAYPLAETVQVDGICREVIVPAAVGAEVDRQAREIALEIAERFDVTGLLAVELFVVADGLLINELALRPHNTGHFTIEASVGSQFEQHLRAILDWPLAATQLLAPAAAMVNVLGPADGSDPRDRISAALAVPGAHVHLYAKGARPGRKLGHVTALGSDRDTALAKARRAADALGGTQ